MGGLLSMILVAALLILTPISSALSTSSRNSAAIIQSIEPIDGYDVAIDAPNIFDIDEETFAMTTGSIVAEGRNALLSASGTFKKWHFTDIYIDRKILGNSYFEVEIDMGEFETALFWRMPHIRGEKFLDVSHHPYAHVRVEKVRPVNINLQGLGSYTGDMKLMIRGKPKAYPFNFTVIQRDPIVAHGYLIVKRSDFGVGHLPHPLNPFAMKDEVYIRFDATIPTVIERGGFHIFGEPGKNEE